MADLLCAMVPMSFHLSHKGKQAGFDFPRRRTSGGPEARRGSQKHLLVEHDGSAVSVFDEHADEGHANEDIVGVIVLHMTERR